MVVGNVYPVIEHPDGQDSIKGQALQTGFDSHYVVTGYRGLPASELFDELVIAQEQQGTPLTQFPQRTSFLYWSTMLFDLRKKKWLGNDETSVVEHQCSTGLAFRYGSLPTSVRV